MTSNRKAFKMKIMSRSAFEERMRDDELVENSGISLLTHRPNCNKK